MSIIVPISLINSLRSNLSKDILIILIISTIKCTLQYIGTLDQSLWETDGIETSIESKCCDCNYKEAILCLPDNNNNVYVSP